MIDEMFALQKLGWNDFQQLCLTITRESLGQTVEAFLDAADGGRDGAFSGTWNPTGQERLRGSFVIQCKFTSRTDHVLRRSDLTDELDKVRRLVARGICDTYVLMTNAGLSGREAAGITALLKDAGVKHPLLLGSTWIGQQIRENKRLRALVPRVYGLGDLSQILDERAYTQARAILESMREDLAKVVVTNVYQKAIDAINRHSFVLLIGEPASGKTTIASLLAMAAVDQWNASLLKLDDPGKVAEHWNPDEPSQFFWLDDAFGVTQYEDFLVRRWNHMLPNIRPMLRNGAKIVMTSRDYIYNRARRDLKESALPLLRESQVVIDVRDLSAREKCQILYNHLKLGRQPRSFRTQIKPFLEDVASHRRFIPEMARRLGDPFFTKGFVISKHYIDQFVEKREQLLQDVLWSLDADSKAALALIYMRNGHLESPVQLRNSESQALERLGSDLGGCVAALEALRGSLVLMSHAGGENTWLFKHPTIGDAYATILARSPEHLDIYLRGSAPERLVSQVTCGDVGIERAVVIPQSLFPQMLARLQEPWQNKSHKAEWLRRSDAEREVRRFLAFRCSKEFLSLYLQHEPELLDAVAEPGLYLDAVLEVPLALRLHEFGLLPEDVRQKFVETVSKYAIEGDDTSALDDEEIRTLFTEEEAHELIQRVQTELLPRLSDVRRELEYSHRIGEPPEEHMQPFLDMCSCLKNQFRDDGSAVELIDLEIQHVNEWIHERTSEIPLRPPRKLDDVEAQRRPYSTRSIFDDVDSTEDGQAE